VSQGQRAILLGNAAGLAAAILFGASVVATREAVDDVPPLSLGVLRFGLGGLFLVAVLLVVAPASLRVPRRDLRSFAVLGALLFGLFALLFNAGLHLTTASRGAVVLATMPLWTALLGRASKRESLTGRQLVGVTLSVVGVGVVFAEGVGLGGGRELAGNALMLAAAFCGALSGVFGKPILMRYPAMPVMAYAMLAGVALLLPPALIEGLPGAVAGIDRKTALLILFLGLGGGALGYWLISFSLARMMPTQTAAYINVNPVVATALAALLLDEDLTETFAVGFALVAVGLLLANWPASARRAAPVTVAPEVPG
jgi:drug/metabolite transporter (DMT)-like permease